MGDILAVIFAITLLLVLMFVGVAVYRKVTAPPGPRNPLANSNAEYYRVAQQAVRMLEVLLRDEMVKGVIRQKDRDAMQKTIDEFYSL